MGLITIDQFYRNYGVRRKDQVLHPPIHSFKDFKFPRNSHLHFTSHDPNAIGIEPTDPLLLNQTGSGTGSVICTFVTDYLETKGGGFRVVTHDLKSIIRNYFKQHKEFVNAATSKTGILLEKNLLITDYTLMEHNVKYTTNTNRWWAHFQNYWGSVFKSVVAKASNDRRNHFIVLDSPEVMPSLSQMMNFEKDLTNINAIKKIASAERMLIAQLWLWFSGKPSIIPTDVNILNRLYFIYRYHDQWICFNLPQIIGFMKSADHKGSWSLVTMRKNFIIMILTMKFGFIDNYVLDGEEEVSDAPLSTDERNKIRQDQKDDTLELSSNPEDAFGVKENLEKVFKKVEQKVDAENDLDVISSKREKRVDAMLGELDTINAAMVDATEDPTPGNEDNALETKEASNSPEVKTISKEDLIDYKPYTPKVNTIEEAFDEHLREMVVKGSVTPQQMKRFEKMARRYKEIPDPRTGVGTLETASIVNKEDLVLSKDKDISEHIKGVNDHSMKKSTLVDFDKQYINKVMHKDIYNATLALQNHGIAIQNYSIKRVTQLGDDYEVHSIKLVPIEGVPSTINIEVPVVDEFGVFQSRSVKNRCIKQRVDIPIRKIGPDEVALTSYMSKLFVERCQLAAYSRDKWIRAELVEFGGANNGVNVSFGNVFKKEEDVPLAYSRFARTVKRIRFKDYDLNFDVSKLNSVFGEDVVKAFEKTRGTQILLGKGKDTILVLTKNGIVHECSIDQKNNVELGPLEEFIGISTDKAPMDCADLNVVTKSIPIGVLLAHYIGLGNLLKTLGVGYYFVPKNTSDANAKNESINIRFADGTLVINEYDYKAQLILAGFNRYHKSIKQYNMVEFDKKSVYGNVFEEAGLPARYMREFKILRSMWVDPITKEELIRMNEPTDFVMLLFRSVEMLERDSHPDAMERAYMRDRGYERFSGFIYDELIKAVRAYDSTPVRSKAKISVNPKAVWMNIIGDETTTPIEESNPIHSLKDVEKVVFRGAGGRSSRTMNSKSRMYSQSAIGVDSEGTVDNGDAGTVKFLTANPNYNSLRGTTNVLDTFDESVNSTCLNTSTLLAPAIEFDDPKRRNFAQIQNSRTTNSEGAHLSPTRTGYEYVLPWRSPDLYATMATEDGVVSSLTENAIVVKYKSGKEVIVELGKRDGKWSGKIIPHNVITELKEGQKVTAGTPIAYNPLFFAVDPLIGTLAYKTGVLGRIGLIESAFTYEDSSELYVGFAEKLVTKNSEVRQVEVPFDKDVFELIKVGTDVTYDTILCVLRNDIGEVADKYASTSLESLKSVSSSTPRAKFTGTVTDISAVYSGDVENMSETLQTIVGRSDSKLYKKARDMKKERVSGQLKAGTRHNGKIIEPNTVIIEITIDISQKMGVGSKIVNGHQMKSVVSNVFYEPFTTQDGIPYDGTFSYTSYIKRIVESTLLAGIINTFCVEIGKGACEIYEKD